MLKDYYLNIRHYKEKRNRSVVLNMSNTCLFYMYLKNFTSKYVNNVNNKWMSFLLEKGGIFLYYLVV